MAQKRFAKAAKKIKKFSKFFRKRQNVTGIGLLVVTACVITLLSSLVFFYSTYNNAKLAIKSRHSAYEDEIRNLSGITTNLESVPDMTASWKTFENKKYNIAIKYPTDWSAVEQESDPFSKYIEKISFTNGKTGNKWKSFEVFVYSSVKYSNPAMTDNLVRKNPNAQISDCPQFDNITLGQAGYPAKEINVKANDPCYKETFFYSLTKGQFTYNIVPHYGVGFDIPNFEEKMSLVKIFPEFYDVVSTINISEKNNILDESRRIISQAAKPRVRFVAKATCAEKNDHPSYSDTKGKHMDEDCCPDPDEWPNPGCAYSAKGYSIMISPPQAKKKK